MIAVGMHVAFEVESAFEASHAQRACVLLCGW